MSTRADISAAAGIRPRIWITARKVGYVLRRWPVLPIIILVAVTVAAVFAPLIAPHDPLLGPTDR